MKNSATIEYNYIVVKEFTLHVADEDAHDLAEDEVPQYGRNQRERHAEERQKQVADGQVQKEDVRQRPHPAVLYERDDDERVADDGKDEDDDVQRDSDLASGPAAAAAAAAAAATGSRTPGQVARIPRRRRREVFHFRSLRKRRFRRDGGSGGARSRRAEGFVQKYDDGVRREVRRRIGEHHHHAPRGVRWRRCGPEEDLLRRMILRRMTLEEVSDR